MKCFCLCFFVLFIAAAFVPSCSQKDVALEGDAIDGPNVDHLVDQTVDEDAADVEDLEREALHRCWSEPPPSCWGIYTADGCTAEKPFCCRVGDSDIGMPCCCEDIECDFPTQEEWPCYEASLSSIVMDCAGDSSNCPAVKPYCCQFPELWGGQYVCADHALLGWTCDGPPEN